MELEEEEEEKKKVKKKANLSENNLMRAVKVNRNSKVVGQTVR